MPLSPTIPPQHGNFNTTVSYMRPLTPRMLLAAQGTSTPNPEPDAQRKTHFFMGTAAILLVLGGIVVIGSLQLASLWKKYVRVS